MQGFENLSDCHLHCHFSSDSEASPESMIDNAVRLGLSHICFTDHNDYDYPKEDGKTVFLLDLDAYLEKISVLKKIYKDKIDVRSVWNRVCSRIFVNKLTIMTLHTGWILSLDQHI